MFNLKIRIMKRFTLLFVAVFGLAILANSQADYTMFKTVYLKPDYENIKDLGKAMAEHNKEFHNEAPNLAHVWLVTTGPHTGQWLLVIGPTTFTDLDDMPNSDEHRDHWIGEVLPNVEELSEGGYWRLDDKATYDFEDSFTGKEVLAFYKVKDFEEYRFQEILEKVSKVYKEKEYKKFFQVYKPQFDDSNSPNFMIASGFSSWSEFDKDMNFKADFEGIHGEGSWTKLMEEYKDVVESSFDEIIIYVPELSGGASE
jgi:hypothetical protein